MNPEQQNGCRCRECWGLAETMLDMTGSDFGLPHAPGHQHTRLRVVTPGPSPAQGDTFDGPVTIEKPCAGTMTCDCTSCQQERARRVKQGASHTRQPWEARAA